MSLERGFPWSYQDWQFTGYTLAGITTSIYCKNASLCFDVGQGLPFQNGARHIAITHAHMDHCGGLPYLISQKNMAGQRDSQVYLPAGLVAPMRSILELWQGVDQHEYEYRLHPAIPGEFYELGKGYSLKPFRTLHRVDSQGYLLYQKKKRLKEEFRNAAAGEIVAARRRGVNPEEEFLYPAVAFTGDTRAEFVEADPAVGRAKILFIEVTFWDQAKPVAEARRWGHLHFDEFLEILPALENERIVLIHASVRYSTSYLEMILRERLPDHTRERVVLYPRP